MVLRGCIKTSWNRLASYWRLSSADIITKRSQVNALFLILVSNCVSVGEVAGRHADINQVAILIVELLGAWVLIFKVLESVQIQIILTFFAIELGCWIGEGLLALLAAVNVALAILDCGYLLSGNLGYWKAAKFLFQY